MINTDCVEIFENRNQVITQLSDQVSSILVHNQVWFKVQDKVWWRWCYVRVKVLFKVFR